jgi:hypothetical protein
MTIYQPAACSSCCWCSPEILSKSWNLAAGIFVEMVIWQILLNVTLKMYCCFFYNTVFNHKFNSKLTQAISDQINFGESDLH